MSTILFSKENGIAQITFNRPKAFNSFNREMAFAFQDALDNCQNDDSVRVVVVRGEGKAFCAGQDLKEVTDEKLNPGFKNILDEHYGPIIKKIRALEKPVIAAVNGVAAGAGANIAFACDIVIAHELAVFIQAFSAIGLIPDSGGTFFLPRLIGFQKATALAMLADKISAKEAEKLGLVYQVIEANEFDEHVGRISQRVSQMPTKALALTKKAFNESLNNTLAQQLDLESKLQIEASETQDYHEGVAAFVEKRKPNFTGK